MNSSALATGDHGIMMTTTMISTRPGQKSVTIPAIEAVVSRDCGKTQKPPTSPSSDVPELSPRPLALSLAGKSQSMTQRYAKKIICLANSRKRPAGRCVAGREVTGKGFGDWIRPVSDRLTQEISLEECRFEDGRDPSLLDVIAIAMKSPQPQQ